MRAWLEKHQHRMITVALVGVLTLCFFYICRINLSLNPGFYCTDMYSDVLYAVRAWEARSIFPDGWVFGNQFYVIATPVWAALIYGITGHAALAMALATILMTVGIAWSLLWMLKPVFPRLEARLVALLGLVSVTAYCGDAVYSTNGWQLFFTMCSYYACYLITAFLCFGFFLRRGDRLTKPRIALFVLTLLLSLGAGMQSLRQTAIMIPSMLAVESFAQLYHWRRERKLCRRSLLMTLALSVSNLFGVLLIRLLEIPQHRIFREAHLLRLSDALPSIKSALKNMSALLSEKDGYAWILLVVLLLLAAELLQSKWRKKEQPTRCYVPILLFAVSVLVIFALDAFTAMTVRSIYYFMLFPLVAVLMAYVYSQWKGGRVIVVALLTIMVVGSFRNHVLPISETASEANSNVSYEISDMLIEKGYTTIYSGWNQCEDIAIASGGKITAGFWDRSVAVFEPVTYLCDPSVYTVESEKCVYYLRRDNREIALQKAHERGVTMTLVAAYPEWGIWLYEASENLMMPQGK